MLTRREVLRVLGLLGVGAATVGCRTGESDAGGDTVEPVGTDGDPAGTAATIGSVVVVGAGAAGLSAAYLLQRAGVEVTILEASTEYGGRMRRDATWVDFPVPLGAEWLHTDPSVLDEIVDDDNVDIDIEFTPYVSDDVLGIYDGELTLEPMWDDGDLKFVDSTWFDVFDEYIVPTIADLITLDAPIAEIEHGDDGVLVTEASGVVHEADAVVVTVPPTILRDGDITFRPALPAAMTDALDEVDIWGGLKVFVEFSERFYPTILAFPDSYTPSGQRLYFDAAHGQDTATNVLGLFAVGTGADRYRDAAAGDLVAAMLAELDEIFDGAASRAYLSHRVLDWEDEPFVRQAYVADDADWRTVRTLGAPVSERLVFAGDSYTDGDDWSAVHVAAQSASAAVDRLLGR